MSNTSPSCSPLFTCILWFFLLPILSYASHNLAGQITTTYKGTNKYELLLTTYTDPAPAQVDRCFAALEIWNASGVKIAEIADIPRENGVLEPTCTVANAHLGVPIYQTVKENIYRSNYTFPGPGKYLIRYFDPTRRADVKNITNPGDINFYIETELFITNPLVGTNSSPVLLNRPLDEACVGKIWTHNPGGYDPDGDSLVYQLVPSQQYDSDNGPFSPIPATGYLFPDNPTFGNSSLSIDSHTGVMTWITPQSIGVYNIAYTVTEYRNGVPLGHVLRDMVIIVKSCPNNPPVIETITDTCVSANDTLLFQFLTYDPDSIDSVYLALNNANIGNNGPFAVINPAVITLSNPVASGLPVGIYSDTIKGNVEWITICDNIRKNPYQVDFYAHDNYLYYGSPGNSMLSAHKALSIKVIPPPLTTLTATKAPNQITLNWAASACNNAVGYRIYRKLGNSNFTQDTICCDMSPSESGFQLIHYQEGWANTSYQDSLEGITDLFADAICYVVTAMFGSAITPNVESCATNTACVALEADTLYLTQASVLQTNATTGEIAIEWSKPDRIDAFYTAPFVYKLYRGNNNQYPVAEIATQNIDDTTFTDSNLNTEIRGYNYRVEVYDVLGTLVYTGGKGENISSSIYLTVTNGQGFMDIDWKAYPSWVNTQFELYRSENAGAYSLVATIPAAGATHYTYQDTGLNPDIRYCYYVKSIGSHNEAGIKSPIFNDSNTDCAFPRNDAPPCNPLVNVSGNCYDYKHTITISKQNDNCDDFVATLSLLYAVDFDGPYVPIANLPYNFTNDTTFVLDYSTSPQYFAGCYSVTSTNIYGVTSELMQPICVDYCPDLQLPNVFSPNGDNENDFFSPISVRSIILKNIHIYDRWGALVHKNDTDIERLWNGKIDRNNKDAAVGVYYYIIEYEEQKLAGNEAKIAKGWILLLR